MNRIRTASLLLLIVLLSSCTTTAPGRTDFVIDNSRVKHAAVDPLDLTVLVLNEVRQAPAEALLEFIDAQAPSILIYTGSPETIAVLTADLQMNMAIITPERLIASRYPLGKRSPEGAELMISEDIVLYADLSGPTALLHLDGAGAPEGCVPVDVGEQTHAPGYAPEVSLRSCGLLPLRTTDIPTAYAGHLGVFAAFAIPLEDR
jgi:hypothetical protein